MDVKKRFGADLEKKKKSFLAIGLLFSLAIVLAGFEYRTYEYNLSKLPGDPTFADIEPEIPPVFIPKPPTPVKQRVVTDIQLVDNADDEDPIEIISLEIDEKDIVDILKVEELPEEVIQEDETPRIFAEEMPEYAGGIPELMDYLKSNINYPIGAKRANKQGKVYISFVVEKDGSISTVKLLRGIGYGCDQEAMRVVKAMPKWEPGKQMGKAVRVQFNLPIKFSLEH